MLYWKYPDYYWKYSDALLEISRCFIRNISMLYWKYPDALLKISRCFIGNIQMLYWKYPDALLEISRCFIRNIPLLYWKHPDALFKVSLHFLNVPRYWSIPIRITIWKYHYICLVIRSSFDCNINAIHVRKKKGKSWKIPKG